MPLLVRNNAERIRVSPHSVKIEIQGQIFQITEYAGEMKIVKIEGIESDNLNIQPCVANSILIK